MSFKIEKDGSITLLPSGEEVSEALEDILACLKNHNNADGLYALTYAMFIQAFVVMAMDGDTVEKFLNLIADHIAAVLEKRNGADG